MKRPVMIGPHPAARGGVATVVSLYAQGGLFAPGACRYLTTAVEGGMLRKIVVALCAFTCFVMLLTTRRVSVLHVLGASRRSFWRKRVFMQAANLFGISVIFHLHGGEFRQFFANMPPLLRERAWHCLRRCERVLCLNDEIAGWLRENLPAVNVSIFPNPVALPTHLSNNLRVRNRVLYLGRIEREKGIFDLIEAIVAARQHEPNLHLIIAGEGAARDELEGLVIASGITEAVDFIGWVSGDAKTNLLRTCGVFALPSHAEGMPMGVLEAMAYRIPIVATNVGAIPELLELGRHGLMHTPGDIAQLTQHLITLVRDSTHANIMADDAYQAVCQKHALDVVIRKLMQLHIDVSKESTATFQIGSLGEIPTKH